MPAKNEVSFLVASTIAEQGEHSSVIPTYYNHYIMIIIIIMIANSYPYFPLREAEEIAFSAKLNPSADPKKNKY